MERNKKTFFGVPDDDSAAEEAKVVVVPVPYDADGSEGSARAPQAVMSASQNISLFDDELWIEPNKIGILTMDPIKLSPQEAEDQPFDALAKALAPAIEHDRFPICVGGSGELTVGAINGCLERFQNLSVLQVTAASNLHQPGQLSSATASLGYRIYNQLKEPILTQVGVTDISAAEVHWMEEAQPEVNIFWARQQERWDLQEIVSTLSDNVYLSIDLSALEAGVMPAGSRPQPGGISYYRLIELIKNLCVRRNVIGADVVNLVPVKNLHGPEFLTARLMYKIIGYRFALQLGVTKKYL